MLVAMVLLALVKLAEQVGTGAAAEEQARAEAHPQVVTAVMVLLFSDFTHKEEA